MATLQNKSPAQPGEAQVISFNHQVLRPWYPARPTWTSETHNRLCDKIESPLVTEGIALLFTPVPHLQVVCTELRLSHHPRQRIIEEVPAQNVQPPEWKGECCGCVLKRGCHKPTSSGLIERRSRVHTWHRGLRPLGKSIRIQCVPDFVSGRSTHPMCLIRISCVLFQKQENRSKFSVGYWSRILRDKE